MTESGGRCEIANPRRSRGGIQIPGMKLTMGVGLVGVFGSGKVKGLG